MNYEKFRVGDFVEVISDTCGGSRSGQIGRVREVMHYVFENKPGVGYCVDFNQGWMYAHEKDFKLHMKEIRWERKLG